MGEQKYVTFISILIEETKEGSVVWDYLDRHLQLCRNMDWVDEDTVFSAMTQALSGKNKRTFYFDTENSFCCKIKEVQIVLYVSGNDPAEMFIIPNTFKRIVHLTPDTYGNHITRLLNLVRAQFPSADVFIDEFISDASREG